MAKFLPGQSGNPAGRPCRETTAHKLRQSITVAMPEILEVMIAQAKAGDTTAAKILIDRALPALKPQSEPVTFDIASNDTLLDIAQTLLHMASRGEIAPDALPIMFNALVSMDKVIDTTGRLEMIQQLKTLDNL